MQKWLWLCIGAALLAWLAPLPVAAHANLERAEPGIGATVATAPTTVRLNFSEAVEPRFSEVTVFDTAQGRWNAASAHIAPDNPASLVVDVRPLPEGVYTVVWRVLSAVDGHGTSGSFAFVVGTGTLTAAQSAQGVAFASPQPPDVLARWLAYTAASTLVGALALWLLIWQPALVAAGAATRLAGAVGRRLLLLAAGAATVLLLATLAGAAVQLTKGTGQSLPDSLTPGTVGDFLFATRSGSVWLLRLLLAFAAAAVLIVAMRATQSDGPSVVLFIPAYLGVILGANGLLATSLLSHAAATGFVPVLAVVADWLHLLASTVWIGGLAGLVLTAPLVAGGDTRSVLRRVVARFSALALVSVGVLSLTGLYAAWLHVGTPANLLPTDYGRTLTVKTALFALLVALGAFNLFWMRPRLGDEGGEATRRRFRRATGAEVALGAGVLLAAAVLTSTVPSREVVAQSVSPLAQSALAGDLRVTLVPSTLAPGPITYDAYIQQDGRPVADAARVTFRFASLNLGVEESEAMAENRGGGHYAATGPYTALPGAWETRVIVRRATRDDAGAAFTLPIGGALPRPADADPTPRLTAGVLVGAGVAVLVVGGGLGAAAWFAGRLTHKRRETPLAAPPVAVRGD